MAGSDPNIPLWLPGLPWKQHETPLLPRTKQPKKTRKRSTQYHHSTLRKNCCSVSPKLFAYTHKLANEENTFNINDLWVSAAVAQDTAVFEEDEDEDVDEYVDDDDAFETTPHQSLVPTPGSGEGPSSYPRRGRVVSGVSMQRSLVGHRLSYSRRFSTSSGQLPTIFAKSGLSEAPVLDDANSSQDPFSPSPAIDRRLPVGNLSAIAERPAVDEMSGAMSTAEEGKTATWRSLPLLMILQVSVETHSRL